MENKVSTYNCDKCGNKLKTCNNSMDIVTSISEDTYWSRLHVQVVHHHGMHNDGTRDQADLCKTCAIKLLTDAVNRIRKGERATAGTEDSEQNNWE